MLSSESDPAADRRAFHQHIGEINRRRIVPLTLATAGLLTVAAISNAITSGRWNNGGDYTNFYGLALTALVLALWRWSPRPGLSAIVYGYAVLGWGDSIAATYLVEVSRGHAVHAAEFFAVFFVTRYLAAMSVVWRPRDLAIALALNHLVALVALVRVNPISAFVHIPIWTATAWVAAYLIYRAEWHAFAARRVLVQQRDQLVEANAGLAELNQEKNDLMAIAAHDLRSPLMGMTTLLRLTAADASRDWPAGVAPLRAVEQSGRDMADLVSRILDVSRAEDELGRLALAPGDARVIVMRAVDAHRLRATDKGLSLSVDAPPAPCLALLDEPALSRVLDNLVSNAVKFSSPGGHVRVRVAREGSAAAITVTDSGPGISEEDRPRLFRKFARLRPRPTAGESSSGLGLYITKRLVDAMGGSIAISSPPEGGAAFVVTLQAASV